jgi:hypothetical protein
LKKVSKNQPLSIARLFDFGKLKSSEVKNPSEALQGRTGANEIELSQDSSPGN